MMSNREQYGIVYSLSFLLYSESDTYMITTCIQIYLEQFNKFCLEQLRSDLCFLVRYISKKLDKTNCFEKVRNGQL